MAQKYTDGRKSICNTCYNKQRAVEMAPSNGCALCERKESSRWHKNTDTGERDICAAATKQRAVEMAPSNGCALCERKESSRWHKNTDTGERDICDACYQNQRAIGMAPPSGVLCARGKLQWHKNTETGERDICAAYNKQRAVEMAPSNGCALCERKESSQWHKNTETGDICEGYYQKQRAIEWHHRTGVLCVRRRKVHIGTKIHRQAKEFVLRATINNDVRHRTGVISVALVHKYRGRRNRYLWHVYRQ